MTVYFYQRAGQWGAFSNFAPAGFAQCGRYWPTAEHYFQAMKFAGTAHEEEIRRARRPHDAARMGRERTRPLRSDWEGVKDEVMRTAVRGKFSNHEELKALLISTCDRLIVENAPGDYYWGCGADGTGRNMLGRILMETRDWLRGR
jgi:N-glycosidase YbiA